MNKSKPSTGSKQVRDAVTGRFLPGNKSGGRKRLPEESRKILQEAAPDACQLLVQTINDKDARLDLRVKCAMALLDRVYGRPAQSIDIDAKNIPQVVFVGGDDVRE